MTAIWSEDQPIYRQLRDRIVSSILDGSLKEGEALPSVRNVAMDMQINPITASKAYQELVAEGLVEKKRGLGMFIMDGAQDRLRQAEQRKFLEEEWPRIVERIHAMGLDVAALLAAATPKNNGGGDAS